MQITFNWRTTPFLWFRLTTTVCLLVLASCSSTDDQKIVTSSGGAPTSSGTSTAGGSAAKLDEWVPPQPIEAACSVAADAVEPEKSVESLASIGCLSDFTVLASVPLSASIPGASSVKVVLDQEDNDALYFQNSKLYKIHYEFASTHLTAVGGRMDFNTQQYSAPDRRFVLGSVTYYAGPKYWALEIAPYDTADAAMIEKLFQKVKQSAFFGEALVFHPTSDMVAETAKKITADIHVKTTDQIYSGIDYQPLNLGECYGRLHFVKTSELETDFVDFRDIVVLDKIPNDISVTAGIITEEFQTPLSHVNVLATNRRTPNMGLRKATTNEALLALKDQPVHLSVTASEWKIERVTQADVDAYWELKKPKPITLPGVDMTVTDLRDIEKVTDQSGATPLRDSIATATLAYGAKAANYSVLYTTPGVYARKAFAIPAYYYVQFMQENGFFDQVKAMLADADFKSNLAVRSERLAELRSAMMKGTVNAEFQALLQAKLAAEYPGLSMRFRTSTNAEDLDGFPCAGCYDSHTGDPANFETVLDAIRETWSGVWFYRTFQEREYHSIDHTSVGMALLVHHNFPDEEANGVAITANIFDPSGLDPAFYVNVQEGSNPVVAPDAGVTSDEFLYYFGQPNQPIVTISHSNRVVPVGAAVLSSDETYQLGSALDAIHKRFSDAYGPGSGNFGFYAMDVEFKFDDEDNVGGAPKLIVKQARPYPGQQSP